MSERYESLDHTADVGFRAWGETLPQLFENTAHALTDMTMESAGVEAEKEAPFETSGEDHEALLVDWLSEVLFLFDVGELTPAGFQIDELTDQKLRARIQGAPRDASRHGWKVIVKAVTYHNIEVKNRNGRWEARVFLDV